jgi:hypothetical protein
MREHRGAMLNGHEAIFGKDSFEQSVIAQITLHAHQVFMTVVVMHQVEADTPVSRGEQFSFEDAAKEAGPSGYENASQALPPEDGIQPLMTLSGQS